jgi:hypothetical protein
MSDQDDMTMIGKGLASETTGDGPVYADSTLRAKGALAALDEQRRAEEPSTSVPLTPREQLQIQVWQAVSFTASNAMLEATDRGDTDDAELAYKMMDMAAKQLSVAYQKIAEHK